MNVYVLLHCAALVFCHSERFFCVIPSTSEESHAMWMLRSAQHDKKGNALRSA